MQKPCVELDLKCAQCQLCMLDCNQLTFEIYSDTCTTKVDTKMQTTWCA